MSSSLKALGPESGQDGLMSSSLPGRRRAFRRAAAGPQRPMHNAIYINDNELVFEAFDDRVGNCSEDDIKRFWPRRAPNACNGDDIAAFWPAATTASPGRRADETVP